MRLSDKRPATIQVHKALKPCQPVEEVVSSRVWWSKTQDWSQWRRQTLYFVWASATLDRKKEEGHENYCSVSFVGHCFSSKMGENPLAKLPDQMGAADFFCIFTDAIVGLDSEGSILQINIVCQNKINIINKNQTIILLVRSFWRCSLQLAQIWLIHKPQTTFYLSCTTVDTN